MFQKRGDGHIFHHRDTAFYVAPESMPFGSGAGRIAQCLMKEEEKSYKMGRKLMS
jgi:hypothetical protein